MKRPYAVFLLMMLILSVWAVSLAVQATHRGESVAAVVLLFAAVIFWKKFARGY
jgi:hypothetical protein